MSLEPSVKRFSGKIPLLEDDPDDFVGYEVLIDFIKQRALHKLEGDIIEIGAYMGRGTAKLAKLAQRYGRKVYAIDVFDPSLDRTTSKSGIKAGDVYEAFLKGRSMLVENDFYVIWPHLVSGGVVGLHDYEFDDWPEVTEAADRLIHKHKREISEVYEIEGKYNILSLLLVKK